MGLTLTILQPGLNSVVLHDGNRSPIPDGLSPHFEPRLDWNVQETDLWRAVDKFLAARYNAVQNWTFTTTRTFPDALTCSDYIGQLPGNIPPAGELQFLWRYAGNTWIRYVKTVFIKSVAPKNLGISAAFAYTIKFNAPYSPIP